MVLPPQRHARSDLGRIRQPVTFAVTGWAMHSSRRLGVDHAIPLSDHADYDELLSAVEQVAPRVVYCTQARKASSIAYAPPGTTPTFWTARTCRTRSPRWPPCPCRCGYVFEPTVSRFFRASAVLNLALAAP